MIGPHCPIDLFDRESYLCPLTLPAYDADGYERGERINGFCECPQCHAWWPCIEEPDHWEEDGERWKAIGWWGAAYCDECGLLLVEQPDGTPEVYQLR